MTDRTVPVPLARMAPVDRLRKAAEYRGTTVTIEVGRERDGRTTVTAELEAVALGSPSDVAILKGLPGYFPRAVSLATIATIRSATLEERIALGQRVEAAREERSR